MKGPSEQAKALLDELSQRPGFLPKLTGRAPDRVSLLHQLAELGEPEVIPHIFWLVVGGPSDVAKAAADSVHSLMCGLSPKLLLTLDGAIRFPARLPTKKPGMALAGPARSSRASSTNSGWSRL